MSSSELREIVLAATREAYPRKPDAVADQVARWFEDADRAAATGKPAAAWLCAFCGRAAAELWAEAHADHSVVVTREKGSATVGLCSSCLAAAVALRSSGVPPRDDIRRRVAAALEREREPEAIEELDRILAIAPALTSDVRDAVCSVCGSPVSYRLVASARTRICDGCLARLQTAATSGEP